MAEGSLAGSGGQGSGGRAAAGVFVDEMGANTSLAPVYAWSRRGERALASVPRNWLGSERHLAGERYTAEGMGECLAVEGSTTREVLEAYLEGVL